MHPDVIKKMQETMGEVYGNPSSIHQFGRQARAILDENRRYLANSIGADEKELYFTSGGTEADNLALFAVALVIQKKAKHITTTPIKHNTNLTAPKHLNPLGFKLTNLPLNKAACVKLTIAEKN